MGNSCSGRQDAELTGGVDAAPTGGAAADPAAPSTTQQEDQPQARDNSDVLLQNMFELLKKQIELNDKILELQIKRDETDKRLAINSKKSSGDYFVTTGALWKKEYITGVDTDQGCKDAVERISERLRAFPLIDCTPTKDEALPIPNPKSCLEGMRQGIFDDFEKDRNIFSTSVAKDINDNSPGQNSLAHSVPSDLRCSVFWPPYVPLLTGASADNDTQRFSAVHGQSKHGEKTHYKDIKNKGIKNVAQNLLTLPPDHYKYYDGSGAGNLIIVPIVDLDQSVDHFKKNQFFDLLVVGNSNVYNWIYNGALPGTADVYSTSLDATVADATEEDITIATTFLNYYTKAAAYIAVTDVKKKLESDEDFFNTMYDQMVKATDTRSEASSSRKSQPSSTGPSVMFKDRITTISNTLATILESEGLCVPVVCQGFDFKDQKVLKVKLKQYFKDIDLDLKLYPSWGPLGMKATANWLVFAGQPLIPCGMDPVTVPVPGIEIDNSGSCSDSSSDGSDNSSVGSISHAVCSPRETTPATVTP